MTKHNANLIEVLPAAPDQQPVLANLIELYAHDFSEFHPIEVGEDGRYGYKPLPLYWTEPGRHPFLVRISGKLAGFVLVKRGSEISSDATIWDMAEFFVLRGYRRHRVGTAIAHEIWRQLPGQWEVRVMEANHAGHQFWQRAISAFTGEEIHSMNIEKHGRSWRLFSFESK